MSVRRGKEYMTGEEIAMMFGDKSVSALEAEYVTRERRLEELQRQLSETDDVDVQEELQAEAERLRGEMRNLNQEIRTQQREFTEKSGRKAA
jgi:predicted  nucleic acid-binding Zn-ribbon protein